MKTRQIEFRGFCEEEWKWVYGNYAKYSTEDDDDNVYHIIDHTGMSYDVDPDTIGQYTGLKDKKGKKIYEGDVLLRSVPASYYIEGAKGNITDVYTVDYNICAWSPFDKLGCGLITNDNLENYEIICNIHEEPHKKRQNAWRHYF